MKHCKHFIIVLLMCTLSGCVEDFEFNLSSDVEGIVVEGYISNLSYNDLLSRPMDTRYFELSIKTVSRVKNVRDEPILRANVELHTSANEVYDYAEIGEGKYGLFYEDFKVRADRQYSVHIRLEDGRRIESAVEMMPSQLPMGELSFDEIKKSVYENTDGELAIVEKEGINLKIRTMPNEHEGTAYYKWNFTTTHIFNAFLADEQSPVKYCWLTSDYYLPEFELLEDVNGESLSYLFFLSTDNARLNEGFSVLIRQTMLSEGYYQFMKDIKVQQEQSELFAKPPYNLETNLSSDDVAVFGYFAVVNENYQRWYFDKDEVSNYGGYKEGCIFIDVPPPYPVQCFDCTTFTYDGPVTNIQPVWWNP